MRDLNNVCAVGIAISIKIVIIAITISNSINVNPFLRHFLRSFCSVIAFKASWERPVNTNPTDRMLQR